MEPAVNNSIELEMPGLTYDIDLGTLVSQTGPVVIKLLEAGETFTASCRCAIVRLDVERPDEDEHDEQRMDVDTDHADSGSEGSAIVSEIEKDGGNGDDDGVTGEKN